MGPKRSLIIIAIITVASVAYAAANVIREQQVLTAGLKVSGGAVSMTTSGGIGLTGSKTTVDNFTMVADAGVFVPYTGLQLGYGAQNSAITRLGTASSSIDFGGVTDTCEDSPGITVTGAAANDRCVVGAPATLPSTTSWFFCYVSASDTVKVRHCAHGASGNPAAATYKVSTFGP